MKIKINWWLFCSKDMTKKFSRISYKIMFLVLLFASMTFSKEALSAGDCDGNGTVSYSEVQSATNMFLGLTPPLSCVDEDLNGNVSITEVQKAINSYLSIPNPDFTLAAPSAVTAVQGSSGTTTINSTISGGFNAAVALTVSGLPTGATATFNPTQFAIPGSGSSILTINAGAATPVGTYSMTVSGTGGGKTHTVTISLVVTANSPTGTQMGGSIQGMPLTLNYSVTTMAGNVNIPFLDGIGTAAGIGMSYGMTTDGVYLYIAESTHNRIRKIEIATSMVTTVAGPDSATCTAANGNCPSGATDGTGTAARFGEVFGITTDGTNLYVTDKNTGGLGTAHIRKIGIATGAVTTLPINTQSTYGKFYGITTDGTNLYTTDGTAIYKIVIATNVMTTLAGRSGFSGNNDGSGTVARFDSVSYLTTDGTNLYLVEYASSRIRKIVISTGAVTTLVGPDNAMIIAFNGFPRGSTDGTGTAARFNYPNDITSDGTNLYVVDQGNRRLRKIVISTGVVTTLPGADVDAGVALDGMNPLGGAFSFPTAINTDGKNLFVFDYYLVLKIL